METTLDVLVGDLDAPDALARLRQAASVHVALDDGPQLADTPPLYDGLIVYSPRLNEVLLERAPHMGGSTIECDSALGEDTLRVLSGGAPRYPVT